MKGFRSSYRRWLQVLFRGLKLRRKVKPEFTYSREIWSELKPFRVPIILTTLIMLFGTLGYIVIDNFNLSDALYQTGITFTTVGFGEIAPISQAGRIFTIVLIIAGFIVFSYAAGLLIDVITKGRLMALIKENRMVYRIARLSYHIVIFYHNEFTVALSRELRKAHIPFVVVDKELTEEIAREHKYPFFIKDDPQNEDVLKKTHLSSAKGVITLSPNVAENIAIITGIRLYEKELGRHPYYIFAIGKSNREGEKLKKLGADEVLTPTKLTAQRLTALIVDPEVNNILERFVYSTRTPLDFEEITVSRTSWLVGRRLKEAQLRSKVGVNIVGIQQGRRFIPSPTGEERIEEGDILFAVGTSKGMRKARKIIRNRYKPDFDSI
ncbi:MAG: TrkA C-terminal domain-containing protein [Campylobacterales bacterium]